MDKSETNIKHKIRDVTKSYRYNCGLMKGWTWETLKCAKNAPKFYVYKYSILRSEFLLHLEKDQIFRFVSYILKLLSVEFLCTYPALVLFYHFEFLVQGFSKFFDL